jgi:hypothetical protein
MGNTYTSASGEEERGAEGKESEFHCLVGLVFLEAGVARSMPNSLPYHNL